MHYQQINLPSGTICQYQTNQLTFGFTKRGIKKSDLMGYLKLKISKELKQIHSDKIFFTADINRRQEGDGIILNEDNILAIIKTADCIPLFFHTANSAVGGILHIGWQGAALDIEKKLIHILKSKLKVEPSDIIFYIGPGICQDCYEVGGELKARFQNQDIINQIFIKKSPSEKYHLDLKKKIKLSLIQDGVLKENIIDLNFCTFTNKEFYSYRRDPKIKGRIYNFMIRY